MENEQEDDARAQRNRSIAHQAESTSESQATPVVDTASSKDPLVRKVLQGALPKTAEALNLLGAGQPYSSSTQ